MIHKKQFTQFAKRLVRAQRGLTNQQLIHPKREWVVGLLVAVGIFAASIVWSSLQYAQYQNIDPQSIAQTDAPVTVYKKALVTEAITIFEQKANQLQALRNKNASDINNPSDTVPKPDTEATEQNEAASTTASTTDTSVASSSAKTDSASTTQTPEQTTDSDMQPGSSTTTESDMIEAVPRR